MQLLKSKQTMVVAAMFAAVGVGLFTNGNADAKSFIPSDIGTQSYVIGQHLFTRETNTEAGYNGYINTRMIMLAAQSISGDSLNDMKVYYKTARGAWVDGLTNLQTTTPDSFEVTMKNLKVFCNPSATNISGAVCMQDMNSSVASSMTANVDYYLKDNRDGKSYKIAKLADGKVWMKQNLALGGDKAITLTSSDSDVSSNFSLPIAQTTGTNSWTCNSDESCEVAKVFATNNGNGNYYSWYTATANSGKYSTSGGSDTAHSICPKGWKLPTGGNSGELEALYVAIGSSAEQFVSATSLTLSGEYGTILDNYGQGNNVAWWSSTAADFNGAYYLGNWGVGMMPNAYDADRSQGNIVRCVAR